MYKSVIMRSSMSIYISPDLNSEFFSIAYMLILYNNCTDIFWCIQKESRAVAYSILSIYLAFMCFTILFAFGIKIASPA